MADIDQSEQTYSQLQKLIFNEISEKQSLSDKTNDMALLKECQKKIKKIYVLLLNDSRFEKFAISDIINRGMETIESIRADEDLELDFLTIQNMNTVKPLEGKKISSPGALCF